MKPFTLNGTKKLVMLFAVTRSPIKAIASVQYMGNGIQRTEVNDCNVPFVSCGFTKHLSTFKSNFKFSAGRKQQILYFTNLTVLHL